MKSWNGKRILMGMALSAGLAIASVSGTGCTTVTNEGTLTINGWLWSKAGRMTDKISESEPVLLEGAYLAPVENDVPAAGAEEAGFTMSPGADASAADPWEVMAR